MSKFLEIFLGTKDARFRRDDDSTDRLSRRYSVVIFILLSAAITTSIYVGNRIDCWCPAQFTESQEEYANSVCWIKNTYYVPLSADVRLPRQDFHKKHINYYQWVPIILLTQAALFYVPSIVWYMLCRKSGLNVSNLVDCAVACQTTNYADIHEKSVRHLVRQVNRYLMTRVGGTRGCCGRFKDASARHCCLVYCRLYGNFLMLSYLLVKLLYLVNALGQLFLLDLFLGMDYHFFGIQVLSRLVKGEEWAFSERFPREVLCDFQIRHMNQVHRWVIQCVLPINLFSEKIFIGVWFWLLFVAAATLFSLITWVVNVSCWMPQVTWVKRHLRIYHEPKVKTKLVRQFTQDYLKRDGMLILRLLNTNVGVLISSEILAALWAECGPEGRYPGLAESREPRLVRRSSNGVRMTRRQRLDSV